MARTNPRRVLFLSCFPAMNPALTVSSRMSAAHALKPCWPSSFRPFKDFDAGKFAYSIEHASSLPASDCLSRSTTGLSRQALVAGGASGTNSVGIRRKRLWGNLRSEPGLYSRKEAQKHTKNLSARVWVFPFCAFCAFLRPLPIRECSPLAPFSPLAMALIFGFHPDDACPTFA